MNKEKQFQCSHCKRIVDKKLEHLTGKSDIFGTGKMNEVTFTTVANQYSVYINDKQISFCTSPECERRYILTRKMEEMVV